MLNNLLLRTDSYKASHFLQYMPNTSGYFGYIESRGGDFDKTLFFGLQIFLKEYLTKPITQEMIDEADAFFASHGEPFNRTGWQHILKKYGGYMPVRIEAVPEGSLIPTGNVLVTVRVEDPECFWVGSYLETMLLRAIWYPVTVATISYNCKKIIKHYMELTSDSLDGLPFKLHDFGARGVSSGESAAIGGAAHLVNFMGSDTVEGVWTMNKMYNNSVMSGFSIPAAEHSTITCWGKDKEVEAYRNMLKQYAKPGALVAVVSDSYDIYNACEQIWGEQLRDEVIKSGATVIVRPDSGDPYYVVREVVQILSGKFGFTTNSKGFKVLNHVKVIQGDGVNLKSIEKICERLHSFGFSMDNVAFGMGGALLQQLNRDTLKFAMKCSAIRVDGKWIDVYKDPVGDKTKASKKGLLSLYFDPATNEYHTISGSAFAGWQSVLVPVYENGKLLKDWTLEEVRERASL